MVFRTITAFSMIKSKVALLDKLQTLTSDKEMIRLLTVPVLFEYVRSSNSFWTHEEHVLRIKVLFLAQMFDDYVLDNEEDDISEVVSTLLSPFPIKHEVFDRWWEISGFELHENSKEIETSVNIRTLETISQTGMPNIDRWLSRMIQEKQRD